MNTAFMVIITLVGISGFILYPALRWQWTFSTAPLFGICTVISFLYIFGLFNALLLGFYLVLMFSVVLTVLAIYLTRKEFKQAFAKLFSPSFTIYLVLFVLMGQLSRFWKLQGWDEYSHWGIFAKAMYYENKFPAQVNFVTVWPNYPPGITIFQYYITKLAGYSEKSVYFAQSIVILSAIMALPKDASWKKGFLVLIAVLFGYWGLYFWGYQINTIYQDGSLGVVFGATIVTYYSDKNRNRDTIIKIAPALFVLPLIKELGIVFALIIVGIIVFDWFMTNDIWHGKFKGFLNTGGIQKLSSPISVILIPVLSFFSWKLALGFWRIAVPVRNANLGNLLNAFSFRASDVQLNTISVFLNKYQNTKIGYAPWAGMGVIIVFFIIMLIYSIYKPEKGYKRKLSIQLLLVVGFLFYSAMMLAFYVLFDPNLQSYTRYFGTYCLGWSYAILAMFYHEIQDDIVAGIQMNQINIIIAVYLMMFTITPLSSIFAPPAPFMLRHNIEHSITKFLPYMEENSHVWVIWQNSNGFEFHIIRYLMAPRIAQDSFKWSLEVPNSEGNLWTYYITPQDWRNVIGNMNYDYVLIGKADDQFWQTYGGLFCSEDTATSAFQLFKVESNCFSAIKP